MKALVYTLLFNISALSFAQDPQLFESTWYLYSVQTTDLGTKYTVSEIDPPINPYIKINENLEFNGEGACNSFNGIYEYISATGEMNSMNFVETGEDCAVQIHNLFENSYFEFISGGFNYAITQDGTGKVLSMQTPLFGLAVFKNYPLSIEDFKPNAFYLYPNPVLDKVFIEANSKIETIKVFDFFGRMILEIHPLTEKTELNFNNLKAGVYFAIISSEGKKTVKKIVKE
ncbi:T9SS type A sorting domain-containing protein [Aequorivita sp. Q41]|uniref:T9SS type A sorting domain-containing protein n=1 Tax=Aequorivita sp. Q41 TaxID=3153300 RepID=UPI003242B4F9